MTRNILVFFVIFFCMFYGTFGVSLLDEKILIKSPKNVYLTQESWFICEASSTVFTNGFKWYLNHSDNGEIEYLGEGEEILNPTTQLYQANKTVLFSSLEISAIICSGKLINGNNEYFNKSKSIQVKVGTKPKIVTKPQTIDPFKLFKIRCEAEGDPLPEFKWIFGKAELPKPFIIPGRFSTSYGDNWTEFESFIQVGKEYENFNLSCLAKNYIGHDEIIFLSLFKKPTWPYFLAGSIILVTFSAAIIVLLIRKIKRSKNKIRFLLSTEEIDEFHNGNEILAKENLSDPSKHIEYLPYNQNFEISKDDICIEHEKILGEGAFGLVIHGYLKGQGQYEKIKGIFVKPQNPQEVAIKTIKPHSGTQYLKTLLYEIKLMIFIKENPNIVKFYGSITSDLIKGRVYMVFEYCQNGNLLEFLRRHRYDFQNSALPTSGYTSIFFSQQESDLEHCPCDNGLKKSSSYVKFPKVREFSIVNLYKWALDTSMGVEYLHKNKIIHADLAARNILLSDDLTAKITDFGLSRHLYEYSNYVKQSQEPLPWRSMSIESLRDMTFSFKSDIWSFGVTLWELFTLGQVPYPGYSWNPQFIEELLQGMRMNKPQFANDKLYQKLLDCWNIDPEKRPNISEFIEFFSQVLIIEQSDKKISQDDFFASIL